MESTKTYRFLAILMIIMQVLFLTLLVQQIFMIIRNIEMSYDISELNITTTPVYLFYALSLFFSVVFFLLFNRSVQIQKKIEKVRSIEKQQQSEDTINKEKELRKREEEAKIEYTVTKILTDSKGQNTVKKFSEMVLKNISKEFEIVIGIFFIRIKDTDVFKMEGRYAFYSDEKEVTFKLGEGISGQVAKDKKLLNVKNVPNEYIKVLSGLGGATPKYMLLFPVVDGNKVMGLIELASFKHFDNFSEKVFNKLSVQLGAFLAQYK